MKDLVRSEGFSCWCCSSLDLLLFIKQYAKSLTAHFLRICASIRRANSHSYVTYTRATAARVRAADIGDVGPISKKQNVILQEVLPLTKSRHYRRTFPFKKKV